MTRNRQDLGNVIGANLKHLIKESEFKRKNGNISK